MSPRGPHGQASGRQRPPPGSDGWLVWAGVAALLLVGLGLHLRLGVGLAASLLAAFLLFTLPVLSLLQLSALASLRLDRPAVYASSALALGGLLVIALGVGALGPGLEAMGLHVGVSGGEEGGAGSLVRATAQLVGATLLLVGVLAVIQKVAGIREHPLLLELIPRTPHERRLFAGLAVVAGVGEEVVFRGFLLAVLAPAFGDPWTALLVSSLAFGVLHAYQGPWGVVRTALLGGLFGASLVLTASLWPAMIVHVVYDWYGGLVHGPRSLPPGETLPAGEG